MIPAGCKVVELLLCMFTALWDSDVQSLPSKLLGYASVLHVYPSRPLAEHAAPDADILNVLCVNLCAGPATCITVRFALTDHKVYSGKPEQKAFIRGRSVTYRFAGQVARLTCLAQCATHCHPSTSPLLPVVSAGRRDQVLVQYSAGLFKAPAAACLCAAPCCKPCLCAAAVATAAVCVATVAGF
jgi:hypothetical protein